MNIHLVENIRFQIDQLRKDKIIYAIEACAISATCLLCFFFSNQYFKGNIKDEINFLLLIIAVGYSVYVGIGNGKRLQKIRTLEKLIAIQETN